MSVKKKHDPHTEQQADFAERLEDYVDLSASTEPPPETKAAMIALLEGKAKKGKNVAVMGFFPKVGGGIQLVGVIRRTTVRKNSFNGDTQRILFVEGILRAQRNVESEPDSEGELHTIMPAGDYSGMWAYQCDAATMALDSDDIIGKRIHIKHKRRARLASGKTRHEYDFVNLWDGPPVPPIGKVESE